MFTERRLAGDETLIKVYSKEKKARKRTTASVNDNNADDADVLSSCSDKPEAAETNRS